MNEVVLSGMRPTGALHIGHYIGVIKNWVELQKNYKCYFFLADWHALNSYFDNVQVIQTSRHEYVKGWIACGVDPNISPMYQQSDINEVLYLNQVFQCLTPPGWADRSPSWKDFKSDENADKKLDNIGFFAYPILQAADIAVVKGKWVPVGEDQVSHVEISREIVRKFNRTYKANLPEPEAKLTAVPKLVGTDGGKKMSSSLGNVISLQETESSLLKKVNKIKTDDKRAGVNFPGNPDNCTVFDFHKIFTSMDQKLEVDKSCRGAQLSCGDCKKLLYKNMKKELMPIAERFQKTSDKDCEEILNNGKKIVEKQTQQTWKEVRELMKF